MAGLEERGEFLAEERARRGADPGALFTPKGVAALQALIVSLADNKFMLGRRYGEWSCSGPTLEASVSAAAMAGDETGHARAFYPLLRDFPGAPAPLERVDDRADIHHAPFLGRTLEGWEGLVAANALFDLALTVLMEGAAGSRYQPLARRVGKLVQEEVFHAHHAAGWVEVLAAEPTGRQALAGAVAKVWPEALGLFGPAGDPTMDTAAKEGIVDGDATALAGRFVARAGAVLAPLGDLGLPSRESLDWSLWDAGRRRYGQP